LQGPGDYNINDAATRTQGHTGKFPFVYRPLEPERYHLAKGVAVAMLARRTARLTNTALAGMHGGDDGGGKRFKDMTPDEQAAYRVEQRADVARTAAHLEKLASDRAAGVARPVKRSLRSLLMGLTREVVKSIRRESALREGGLATIDSLGEAADAASASSRENSLGSIADVDEEDCGPDEGADVPTCLASPD
jgi:hypothetical protein